MEADVTIRLKYAVETYYKIKGKGNGKVVPVL
jgi:hypothetical protein